MRVLVLNAGSSSIKYQVFDMQQQQALLSGGIDCIGETGSDVRSHHDALERIVANLRAEHIIGDEYGLDAIGHRVVHGGERFQQPALIDADVIHAIRDMIPLAPLHNPANLDGIEVAQRLFPNLPQVAVFDTAFHQSMPAQAFHYAVPKELYEQHKVRRYGFHGTSHQYVARQAVAYLQAPASDLNLITLHLGNGCSVTAIEGGKSVDTSMGMTPLEGLVMGTRCGDVDPALYFYLQRASGLLSEDIEHLFNRRSGLKGLCGVSDMREVQQRAESGDMDAQLAESLFAYRVRKYVGAYFAVLGRVDALVFTGGIGEHSAHMRELICDKLDVFNVLPDLERNRNVGQGIQAFEQAASAVKLLVIPTNEELEIARSTVDLVTGQ